MKWRICEGVTTNQKKNGIFRRFDTCGHMLTPRGFTYERGLNELDAGQYDHGSEILGAKGAALIVRKRVFKEAGGFDEDFLLKEETDLCWRIWLRGYRVVFAPKVRSKGLTSNPCTTSEET